MSASTPMKIMAIMVAAVTFGAAAADAELKWKNRYVGFSTGYDSNVNRVSSDAAPPGVEIQDDARFVGYGALGFQYQLEKRLEAGLDLKPYYIKYAGEERFDRGDALLAAYTKVRLSNQWSLEFTDRFRVTAYPNRSGWDRFFNSLRSKVVFRPSGRWWTSLQYRSLYRDNPRSNLDYSYANGIAASVHVSATTRLSVVALGQIDFQTVRFLFPRDESGERSWIDLSFRYLLGRNTLLMGKYMFQHDDMGIVFAQGTDFDKLGDAAEDATDGIFQSIRFLEATDFNFDKHLFILSSHTSLNAGSFVDILLLYQHKHLQEPVLERADRPDRVDDTFVTQVGYERAIAQALSLMLHLRYETNDSNDPDNDFWFVTSGVALKYSF
ncbi:MAG: hypothetical protein OEN01_10505 [Candidatus Krumholzibacteria bacterium]|nr:hypothetical protein [Candidatus Krumholzibacteria bacterium]